MAAILVISIFALFAAFTTPVSATGNEGILGYEIVAHRISLTADPEEIPADGTSTSTITAQLTDHRGNDVLVEDVIINFRTTRGTLGADSAVTDEYGTATVTLTSSTKHGTAVIKATSDSVLNPGTTRVKVLKTGGKKGGVVGTLFDFIGGLFGR